MPAALHFKGSNVKYHTSKYLVISRQSFLNAGNPPERNRLAYFTKNATLFLLPEPIALSLMKDQPEAIAPETLNQLIEKEILTLQPRELETEEVITRFVAESNTPVFVLMPTADCNMRCAYCGQTHRRMRWTEETRSLALQKISEAMSQEETPTVELRWYGGEPLLELEEILAFSKLVSKCARLHNAGFFSTMTTNGSLLSNEALAELHQTAQLRKIAITIDGDQESHDSSRRMKSRKPTYHHILSTLNDADKDATDLKGLTIIVRINITVHNIDHIKSLLVDLTAIKRIKLVVQFSPVYDWGHSNEQLKVAPRKLQQKLDSLIEKALHLGLLTEIVPASIAKNTCIAVGRNKALIDPMGRMFNCTEYPLVQDEMNLGTLREQLGKTQLRPSGLFDNCFNDLRASQAKCYTCAFLPVCGGGCPKEWKNGTGRCPDYARDIEGRFLLLAKRFGFAERKA